MAVFSWGDVETSFAGAFAVDGATLLDNPVPGGLVSVGEDALLWMFDTNDAWGPGLERRNIGVVPTPEPDHELVVFSTPSGTFAVNGATGEQVWRDGDIWARAFGVGDVDGDGAVEVVKPDRGIRVIDGLTGQTERVLEYPTGTDELRLGIELADVDRDGILDIVGIFETSKDGRSDKNLVAAMNGVTGEAYWAVDLGPHTGNDLTSAMPHAFDVTGDGFSEVLVGQSEGPWHPDWEFNPNEPPRILVIDAQRGIVLWEQAFYDKNRYEITVANHDGDAPYEIFNVGHFFLTAWEPTLEDRGTSAIPDDTSDGLGAEMGYCS